MPEAFNLPVALSGSAFLEAAAMALLFVGLLFLGSMILPGQRITGPDADGNQRIYKLNGFALFLIAVAAAGLGQAFGWFSLSILHTHFAALFIVANVFAFAFSGWLQLRNVRAQGGTREFWRGYFAGPRSRSNLFWAGSEVLQLPAFAHWPCAAERIVCRRSV